MNHLVGETGKSRIIAFVIDNVFASLLAVLGVGVIGSENPLIGISALAFGYLLYFFLFEALWSRTPGKFLQGLVVRKLDGSPSDVRATLIRTVARILEANPILLGGIPAGIAIISSAQKQRLGDMLAGTVVVSKHVVAQSL
jgi:uncharacterized RDD family membrane protein YckC